MSTASRVGGLPRRGPGRRPRWGLILVVALIVVPTAEIAAIVAVGRLIGTWPTVALLLVESLFGAWIVRREGAQAWRALRQALRTGRMPSRELADAALILVGGTLLLTPGFLTDLAGFVFVIPVTRPLARAVLEAAVARRLFGSSAPPRGRGPGEGPGVIQGEVVD